AMFLTLLIVTFAIAVGVASLVAWLFKKPAEGILQRIIADDISHAWARYLMFAIYVVGIGGGVRIWELERYITGMYQGNPILELTIERWVLEVYRTVIGTLQSCAWLLLVFFVVTLLAYVIVRVFELRRPRVVAQGD
nr:hypothetical protein [Chloroflexaceae bacterium]